MDQETKNKALITAAQQGNQEELIRLINDKADLNYQDEQGNTPLHWAAKGKKLDILTILIDKKSELIKFNKFNKEGYSLLALACTTGRKEFVTTLLKTEDINEVDPLHTKTPLVTAIQKNDLEIVKILLEHNADFKRTVDDKSPLIWAIEGHSIDIVTILLPKLDNISSAQNNVTPLFKAIQENNQNIANILLDKRVEVNTLDKETNSYPLDMAVKMDMKSVVKRLLTCDEINIKDSHSLLSWAIKKGDIDTIMFLINKPTDITLFNTCHLLNWAANNGHTGIVNSLLEKNVEVNHEDLLGYSALHWAAERGYTNIVDSLLGKEADVNKNNKNGHTPLGLAAMEKHEDIMKKLIEKHAALDIKIHNSSLIEWVINDKNKFSDSIKEIVNKELKKETEVLEKDMGVLEEDIKKSQKTFEKLKEQLKELEQQKEENEQQLKDSKLIIHNMGGLPGDASEEGNPSLNENPANLKPSSNRSFKTTIYDTEDNIFSEFK